MNHAPPRLVRTAALVAAAMVLWMAGCTAARTPSERTGAPAASSAEPTSSIHTDIPPDTPREFRAVWIATVANIDWPSEPGLPVHRQQAEMRALLDRAVELNLNAIILQVRPAADALYASDLEPWSEYLTGRMGRPPEPLYDPLELWVEEAHRRGLELHAWFNPYRAYHASANSPISDDHVSRTQPGIVRQYGDFLWLDPGEPDAHAHTLGVILDVVERYDVDGVHFDDYFYPYRAYAEPGDTEFPDSTSWARAVADGVTLSRDDWRRQNVDALIEELYREIKARKPHVKFGISPFGIWRPGHPPGTTGFDAHSELYADARKWLREGWVDYFTPQIYYKIDQHAQPYPLMLRWWIEQNVHNRHIWPGNFTGRAGRQWAVGEIPGQIYVTRAQPGASGNVHFSMRAFMRDGEDGEDGLVDVLTSTAYAEPAVPPAMPWLDDTPPARPTARFRVDDDAAAIEMTPAAGDEVWLWSVRMRRSSGWSTAVLPGRERELRLQGEWPDLVFVTALDRLGNESAPARITGSSASSLRPEIIPHEAWEARPRLGYAADAVRRNLAPRDALTFRDLGLRVLSMEDDMARLALWSVSDVANDSVNVDGPAGMTGNVDGGSARMNVSDETDSEETGAADAGTAGARASGADSAGGESADAGGAGAESAGAGVAGARANDRVEIRTITDGEAFVWNGYRIAVLALNTEGGLGGGLAELEIATVESLPDELVEAARAGDATHRLRVPHEIRRITLHHSGSSEPLMPEDDPVEKLRGLQAWGQSDRNWWDVPYHFLIDLEGRIYEGRDFRYVGETNTTYDPAGHLLISVIGNYNRQKATPEQIEAITDLMAWASARFGLPPGEIYGHSDWAKTSCPGEHLQKYLDDGTFVEGVRARLDVL